MAKITVIARFKIADGKDDDFKAAVGGLAAQVLEKEEGCELYQLTSSKEPGNYVLVERYVDKAALQAHGQTDHFKNAGGSLAACLDGAPSLEFLRDV